ncbi:hypothetical protein TNCV_10491 [Trichonephila clavipes]|nr:hypothetical protein TNCV_10491 [Trichonephila clavipes]
MWGLEEPHAFLGHESLFRLQLLITIFCEGGGNTTVLSSVSKWTLPPLSWGGVITSYTSNNTRGSGSQMRNPAVEFFTAIGCPSDVRWKDLSTFQDCTCGCELRSDIYIGSQSYSCMVGKH